MFFFLPHSNKHEGGVQRVRFAGGELAVSELPDGGLRAVRERAHAAALSMLRSSAGPEPERPVRLVLRVLRLPRSSPPVRDPQCGS